MRSRALLTETLLAAVLLAATLLQPLPAVASGPVSPAELAAVLERDDDDGPLVLDVRTPEEFAAGHVPGAVLVPHDQLDVRLPELGSPRQIVVYCRTGRRSALAEALLRKRGYQVVQLQGSWLAWQAGGLPVDCPEGGCTRATESRATKPKAPR